jgi:hypothetical protein
MILKTVGVLRKAVKTASGNVEEELNLFLFSNK